MIDRFRVAVGLTLTTWCVIAMAACGGAGASGPTPPAASLPSGCPGHRMKTKEVRAANRSISGLRKAMVPGRPSKLLLCRYYGPEKPGREGDLAQSATIHAPRVIDGVAGTLNRSPVPGGTSATCEADNGGTALAFFGYPEGAPVEVAIDLSGCRFSTNGTRLAGSSAAQIERIAALVE